MELINPTQLERRLEYCPKCSASVAPGQSECLKCGVLFPKLLAQIEDPLQADYRREFGEEFVNEWQKVLGNYEDQQTHWNFILYCQQYNALEFAAYRYNRLATVVNDDLARLNLKYIEALMLVALDDQKFDSSPTESDELFWLPRWFTLSAYFLSGCAIVLGISRSGFSAAGLFGTILLATFVMLRVLFRYYGEFRKLESGELKALLTQVVTGQKV